jgi:outer membrane protein assembly factor BamB
VLGDGRVYVVASDEYHALDAATGETLWRAPMPLPLEGPLTFDAGWLIGMYERGDVIALRAADGREIWRRRIGSGDSPLSAPVPGERDAFYLTLDDGTVVALSLTDGRVLWEQRLPGRLSPPAWAPDRVFVGSTDNFFYALNASDGSLAWKWRSGGDVIGAAADGDVVYYASLDNIIRAVNRGNGNQRWRKDTGTRPVAPPEAFGRVAIVAGISPTLTAFAARDGAPLGTYTAAGALQGRPLLDPSPKPFRVSTVLVLRNGQVVGLHSVGLFYREQPEAPLAGLPGTPLQREPAPRVLSSAGSP